MFKYFQYNIYIFSFSKIALHNICCLNSESLVFRKYFKSKSIL